jgi:hypothetical protein
MSRAMNVALPEPEVQALCRQSGVSVSAMEPLPQGGCHLVCTTGEGADTMRAALADHLIATPVKRFPFYRR